MEKIDIILWILGGGFGLMVLMWLQIDKRFDKIEEKITDIDRRLCRLEGAFSAKECCAIKHNNESKAG